MGWGTGGGEVMWAGEQGVIGAASMYSVAVHMSSCCLGFSFACGNYLLLSIAAMCSLLCNFMHMQC